MWVASVAIFPTGGKDHPKVVKLRNWAADEEPENEE